MSRRGPRSWPGKVSRSARGQRRVRLQGGARAVRRVRKGRAVAAGCSQQGRAPGEQGGGTRAGQQGGVQGSAWVMQCSSYWAGSGRKVGKASRAGAGGRGQECVGSRVGECRVGKARWMGKGKAGGGRRAGATECGTSVARDMKLRFHWTVLRAVGRRMHLACTSYRSQTDLGVVLR